MPTKKGKKLDETKVEQHMEAYTEKASEELLDQAFSSWDKAVEGPYKLPVLRRSDNVIINGRSLSDQMMENFDKEFKTMRNKEGKPYQEHERGAVYSRYLLENERKFVNQSVARALMNGEKVEVFVPDPQTGRIGDTPMILNGKGYQLSDPMAKPAKLNRWQKFWGKLGFYKKEREAIRNYETRQKAQFRNKVARANLCTNSSLASAYNEELRNHFPETVQEMKTKYPHSGGDPAQLGQANGFKTKRSSFHSLAICVLATQRDENGKLKYTNEQLFDMNDPKMQKARAEAMKDVYDHYKTGDTNWLVELQHDAVKVLTDRADEQAKKLDFSKPDLTEQKDYREFALLSHTAFDQSQDMNATQKQLDEKYGSRTYWSDTAKIGAWSQVTNDINGSLIAQKNLMDGLWGGSLSRTTDEVAKVMKAQALQQQIAKTLKEHPEQKLSEVANDTLLTHSLNTLRQSQYDDITVREAEAGEGELPALMQKSIALAQEKLTKPEEFNEQIRSGVLEKRIQFNEFTDDIDNPAKMEIRDAKTAERELKQASPQQVEGAPVL